MLTDRTKLSFRHQSVGFQAIRVAFLMSETDQQFRFGEPETERRRNNYYTYLIRHWTELSPYCFLKTDIEHLAYLNPADLVRWNSGGYYTTTIGPHDTTRMLPVSIILSGTIDESTDRKLREEFEPPEVAGTPPHGIVEILSWFVYREFRQTFPKPEAAQFGQTATIFIQKSNLVGLKDEETFFAGLQEISLENGTWKPVLMSLLKGNFDAFVIYGKAPDSDAKRRKEQADEFISALRNRTNQRLGAFWQEAIPIIAYFGSSNYDHDVIHDNIDLLRPLNLTKEAAIPMESETNGSQSDQIEAAFQQPGAIS